MSFGNYFKKGIEIVKLNQSTMSAVAGDSNATMWAFVFVIISSVITSIINALLSGSILGLIPGLLISPIMGVIGFVIVAGVIHILAKIFGGKATYTEFLRAVGIGSVIGWVSGIPVIGILTGLWGLVMLFFQLKAVHRLSTGAAIVIVLIMIFVIAAIAIMLALLLFTAGLATGLAVGGALAGLAG